MKRRDFFKALLGAVGCVTLLPAGNALAQVLDPPHGKRKGILTVPYQLSQHQVEALREHWHAAVLSDKPIVLTGGMKYDEVFIPEDTELQDHG